MYGDDGIYKKNAALFASRFPSIPLPDAAYQMSYYEITPSRCGTPTARDGGVLLHSLYDPAREARRLVGLHREQKSAIFCAVGLGYAPIAWTEEHSGDDGAVIIIESSRARFFEALRILDWSSVLRRQHLVIALDCPAHKVIALIESVTDIRDCAVFAVPSQTAHDAPYFGAVASLIERNKRKADINDATTSRFANRWVRNVCMNTIAIASRQLPRVTSGVRLVPSHECPQVPVTVLAAGPSLQTVLPYLCEIQHHSLVIAVDTAVRAVLRCGVFPDYIVITDPQYYAWRHIASYPSPSSVLVSDLSVYPAALRYDCRAAMLTSSAIPLARYFEGEMHLDLPSLGAGGSVSSCAWNLAYLLGASQIYIAGLDLSFPRGETHIRGSTIEENAHMVSNRVHPTETASIPRLFSGGAQRGVDYNGCEVMTDSRMLMFAWWFESRLAEAAAIAGEGRATVTTHTLCPTGLRIPGVTVADISAILAHDAVLRTSCNTDIASTIDSDNSTRLIREARALMRGIADGTLDAASVLHSSTPAQVHLLTERAHCL